MGGGPCDDAASAAAGRAAARSSPHLYHVPLRLTPPKPGQALTALDLVAEDDGARGALLLQHRKQRRRLALEASLLGHLSAAAAVD